jgi:hypothetical protein
MAGWTTHVLAYVGLAFLLTFAALAFASIWLLDKTWSPLWHRLHARWRPSILDV